MNKFLAKSKEIVRKYSPIALSCLASAGVIATAVLSAKATPKALVVIDSKKDELKSPELTTKETIKAAWKCYIPTAAVGTATIVCIIGSNALSRHQQAALVGAYAIVQKTYADYKNKLKELYGEEAHEAIMDAIVKEKCEDVVISASGGFYDSSLDFGAEVEPDIQRTFYETITERYFESTTAKVIEAEYHLSRNFVLGGAASLNEFYEFLGLEKSDEGETLGWSIVNTGVYWLDFNHYITHLDDGMEIHVIEPIFYPDPGWKDDI